MNFFKVEDATTLDEFIRRLNIIRIPYAAIVFFAFQVVNFINGPFDKENNIIWGSLLMTACLIIYSILVTAFGRKICERPKIANVVFLSYWWLMIVAMLPYFIFEAKQALAFNEVAPINATLFCTALIIIPIFSKKQMLCFFFAFMSINTAIAVAYNTGLKYAIFIIALSLAGIVLSYLVQHQYIEAMWSLKMETMTDPLTGLLNRKAGFEKMASLLEYCKRTGNSIAVYMTDIDFFKKYNDEYGHLKGDEILKLVADTIKSVFMRSSDLVCRFGGEEFMVCSTILNKKEVVDMSKNLLEAINRLNMAVPQNEVCDHLTVSVGCAVYTPTNDNLGEDILHLISRADEALYKAKRSGRNRFYCDTV